MDNPERVSEAVASPSPVFHANTLEPIETTKKAGSRGILREIIETVVLTAVIFLAVRVLIQNYKVEGYSMEPTLQDGQYLLVNKIGMHFSPLHRGDIIVFEYPLDTSKSFVKRVIGLPGDTVEVQNRQVIVDGKVLNEPYIQAPPNGAYPKTVVPQGEYFVMGDNRNNSSDSRFWGPLPQKDVIGTAWVSYWPPQDWGLVRDYKFPELAQAAK